MATQDDVQITVKVDAQGAIKAFNTLGEEIQGVNVINQKALEGFTTMGARLVAMQAGVGLAKEAFSMLSGAFSTAASTLSKGSEVQDMSEAFDRLSSAAGTTSDVFINQLKTSTANTIPELELMTRTNEALNAGFKPDQIIEVAKAARAMGETFGGSLKDNMDGILDSLQRGNDKWLQARGVIIDNNVVLAQYALAHNKLAKDLSETEKKTAMQTAGLKALAEQTARVGTITDDAGDKVLQMGAAWTNAKNNASKAIVENKSVIESLDGISKAIGNIDWANLTTNFATMVGTFAKIGYEFASVIDDYIATPIDKMAGYFESIKSRYDASRAASPTPTEKAATQSLRLNIEGTAELTLNKINELLKVQTPAAVAMAQKSLSNLSAVIKQDGVTTQEYSAIIERTHKVITALGSKFTEAAEAEKKASEKAAKAAVDRAAAYKRVLDRMDLAKSGTERITKAMLDGYITTEQANIELKNLEKTLEDSGATAKEASKAIDLTLNKTLEGVVINSDKAAAAVVEMDAKIEEASKGFGQSLADSLFGTGDSTQRTQDMANSLGQELSQALHDGLQLALDNSATGADWKKFTENLGSGVGSALGSYFGPVGAAIGSVVGEKLFSSIFAAFGGGDSAGTKARKQLDGYFADLFDGKRLGVIVNGQMQRIDDLVFNAGKSGGGFLKGHGAAIGGGVGYMIGGKIGAEIGAGIGEGISSQLGKNGGGLNIGQEGWDATFQGLSDTAKRSFQGVGDAFTLLNGQMDDFGGNLGAVFANNIGGSLNNLQLLIQSTGLSAEQLNEQIVKAFEDGKMSALDAQSALLGIQQVTQVGIPDGIGLVDEAFKNLEAAGAKGGATLVDAMKDIGAEATELGIKDLPGIAAELKRRLPESSDAIDQLFNALADSGITSIDALTTATTQQLLPALAQLEATNFPFAKASEDVAVLIDQINQLEKEIHTKVVIDVEINDPNKGLALTNTKIGTTEGVTP